VSKVEQPPVNRVVSLPKAKSGAFLPHNGLRADEEASALELGYELIDVRFEEGQRAVDLTLRGLRIGTVVLSDDGMRAFELEVRLYKEQRTNDTKATPLSSDVIDVLAGINPSTKFQALLPPSAARETASPAKPAALERLKPLTPRNQNERDLQDAVRKAMKL
jgi:hypothetical protein